MSLLDSPSLIDIKLYYKYVDAQGSKRLVILEDSKAIAMLEDVEKGKGIEILETKWGMLNWKEQNEVMDLSSQTVNPQTGEKRFNFLAYRDAIIKRCLRTWNLTMNEKPVTVSGDAIDSLPGPIVIDLYQKFEKMLEYSEEELGN